MILFFFIAAQYRAGFQFAMPHKFQCDQPADLLKSLRPRQTFHILKGQKNNRILPLMACIKITALPYFLIFKINRCILGCFLEEHSKHIHIQRFPESARPRKKRNHRFCIQKVTDHQRLIHVIIVRCCRPEVRDADRERLLFHRDNTSRNQP